MAEVSVLVSGAGPTGLVLALWLTKSGISVRIIDKAPAPGATSRAIVFHARNLEFYAELGIAQLAIERGIPFSSVNLWRGGTHVGRIALEKIGAGISRYPYMLVFPQDQQEQMLSEQLAALNVHVERDTELLSFSETKDGVRACIKNSRGDVELCDAQYLAGCDGAHSLVRDTLGVGFSGGSYDYLYYVADVEAQGAVANGEMHGALDEANFLAIFPMKGRGRVRLVGQVEPSPGRDRQMTWNDVSGTVIAHLPLSVIAVRWFSTYHVGYRVAGAFRRGRTFLLGDAAHIHSPVGGQGMNTGIGDAVNLAWKLAAVIQGRAAAELLDTYEPERIRFARTLVRTTDRAFRFVTARGRIATFVRLAIVPVLLPLTFKVPLARRLLYLTVSQTAINYRRSRLSAGRAGRVRGGDRLPWVPLPGGGDNYTSLVSRDWQVHIYGEATSPAREYCATNALALHEFAWHPSMGKAGFARNALYLVRPDGHVGFVSATADTAMLARYVDEHQLRFAH